MMELLRNPAIVSLIAGIPALAAGVFGYWRSKRLDQHAAASEGWRALIASRDAEIQELRKQIAALLAERGDKP